MADLQEQLQAILGDPEAMGQIAAIARALTGGPPAQAGAEGAPPGPRSGETPGPGPAGEVGTDYVPAGVEPSPEERGTALDGGPREERPTQLGPAQPARTGTVDLSALLGALGGGGLPDLDPRLLQIALRVFSEYSAQDDEKAALLSALKPFLRAERREKLEKAEKLARLSRVVRVAIQLLKEEGEGHV